MSTRRTTRADVARALWLLGLEPPVDERELARAWRGHVARTHPDLHIESDRRAEAATLLTTALNDARRVVAEWIDSGREWPAADGGTVARPRPERPQPETPAEPEVCRRTGLRRGDLVRSWPYDGEPVEVRRTKVEAGAGVWVVFEDGGAERAERVRLAVYSCPVRSVRRPRAGAVPDPAVPRLPRRSRAPRAAAGRGAAYSLSHRGAVGGRPGDRAGPGRRGSRAARGRAEALGAAAAGRGRRGSSRGVAERVRPGVRALGGRAYAGRRRRAAEVTTRWRRSTTASPES